MYYKGTLVYKLLFSSATTGGWGWVGIFYFTAKESVITTYSLIYLDFQNLKFKLKCNHVAISR